MCGGPAGAQGFGDAGAAVDDDDAWWGQGIHQHLPGVGVLLSGPVPGDDMGGAGGDEADHVPDPCPVENEDVMDFSGEDWARLYLP